MREPLRRPWLKSVMTLSPFWKRVTFDPTSTTSPVPSDPGIASGLILNMKMVLNRYILNTYLGYDEVAIVKRYRMKSNKHIVIGEFSEKSLLVEI